MSLQAALCPLLVQRFKKIQKAVPQESALAGGGRYAVRVVRGGNRSPERNFRKFERMAS